jgi:hypothetical protein
VDSLSSQSTKFLFFLFGISALSFPSLCLDMSNQGPFPTLNYLEAAGRLGLSVLFGGAIGLQRELEGHPAGLRTHILVSLGRGKKKKGVKKNTQSKKVTNFFRRFFSVHAHQCVWISRIQRSWHFS